MSLTKSIANNAKLLTKTESEILSKLLKQKNKIRAVDFTVSNLASLLHVSSTTLFRMSRKLGYTSFTSFKEDYFRNSDIKSYTTKSSDNYINMVTKTAVMVNESFTISMLQHLVSANRIIIYGMGINFYIAQIFQIKLRLLGFNVEAYDDSRFMRLSSKTLKQGDDSVIVLSRSGQPPELIEALVEVNQHHVYVLLCTESKNSPLKTLATDIIYTDTSFDSDQDIDTRINMHIALDVMSKQIVDYMNIIK